MNPTLGLLAGFKSQMVHGLWMAFKWPFAFWMGWMLVRMLIGPVWKAIAKTFSK